MPIGARRRGGLGERAGDGQVDQARRAAHDDVARLDVEVDDALAGEVVQRGGDVQAERQELLERERWPSASSSSSVGPSRCSSTRCGKGPGPLGPSRDVLAPWAITPRERPQARRRTRGRRRGGRGARAARLRGAGRPARWGPRVIGAQDLGHEHGEAVLVPDEHRLVAAPAADPAQHGAARARARHPRRTPRWVATRPGLLPRRRVRDRGVHLSLRPA